MSWVWSRGPPEGPGEVGKPFRSSEVVGRPSRMSGRARRAHLEVREWPGGPPGGPGVGGSPSRRCKSGQVALLKVRDWLKALPEVWEWLVGPLKDLGEVRGPSEGPEVIRRPFQRFGSV